MAVSWSPSWPSSLRFGVAMAYILHIRLHLVTGSVPTYYLVDYCSNTLDMGVAKVSAGRLVLHRPQKAAETLDCHMSIKAPSNKMLTFKFQHFDIKSSQGCSSSHLQIFGDITRQQPITERLCNANMPGSLYATSGEDAIVQLTKEQLQGDNFELIFTSFRFAPCISGEYQCDNAHCIDKDLYCNGFDNCGDKSDICLLRKETVIGIIAGAAAIVVICVIILTVCLIRRQRKIRRERVSG